MNDYKIVIDAGHGGVDSGAVGNGIIEKDLTLKISKYIYEQLKSLGIPVKLTRTDDETLDPNERINRILNSFGDNSNVIVVSNHINAGGGDGAEVIYALRNNSDLSNIILKNLELSGQNTRKAYQRRLPSDTSKDYYFIHRDTGKTQPIIIEYGFLDSDNDDIDQLKNNYKKLAQAVVDSLIEYIGTKNNIYVVKQGDTLWNIAKKYNTTVDEIKKLNNLNSNNLSINQKLIIPNNENIYIVKQGDTLYNIAKQYNTTVDEIKNLNNLINNNLNIGQKLKIPTNTEEYIIYTVVRGDNLYSIAKKYNVTQQEIMKLNNLSTNLLSIGQKLKIPTNTENFYIVKQGDTLWNIAKKYNTTVDNIKKINNLQTNTLSIGQKLKI